MEEKTGAISGGDGGGGGGGGGCSISKYDYQSVIICHIAGPCGQIDVVQLASCSSLNGHIGSNLRHSLVEHSHFSGHAVLARDWLDLELDLVKLKRAIFHREYQFKLHCYWVFLFQNVRIIETQITSQKMPVVKYIDKID